MFRLVVLSLCVLILSGCAATTQEAPTPALGAQPAQPTAPAASSTAVAPTATSRAALPEAARYAAFAATWQQANQDGPEATALVYFGPFDEQNSSPMALWRVNLMTTEPPQLVGDSPVFASTVVAAALSNDQQWLAYSTPISDWPNELRGVRVDGTDERVMSTLTSHTDCFPIFAWLKSRPTLIYNVGTVGYRAYDATTGSERLVIPYAQAGELVGIDSQDQIVMAVRRQREEPRGLVAADPLTGAQEVLGQFPARLFCRKLSPDGRYLLFGTRSDYRPYVFDRETGQRRRSTLS